MLAMAAASYPRPMTLFRCTLTPGMDSDLGAVKMRWAKGRFAVLLSEPKMA